MKKTVGVLSLIVMLLSQVFTPFAYAVSGEEVLISEPVVEEIVSEPEVVEKGSSDETKDPENPVEEENIIVNQEQMSGDNLSGTNTEILSGGTIQEETTEENLEGKEDTDVIIENNMVVEAIKKGLGGEVEYNSEEVRGTKEHKNVKVEVYAETGAFEETPTLLIEPLESEKETEIKKVILDYNEDTDALDEKEIEQIAEEKITEVVAFDIKFLDKEEKEVQPREGMVKVEFNYTENETLQETEEHEVKVYHLDDKDNVGNTIEEIKDMKIDEPEVMENKEVKELEKNIEEEQILTVIGDKFSIYTIVKQVKEEGLINFEYGMISIENPNNHGQGITIMDRNLGATTTGVGMDVKKTSYGYFYQWGNNYGFSPVEDSVLLITGTRVVVSGMTTYYSSTFVKVSNSPYTWMSQNNNNLWPSEGQGPCPEGWHVPSIYEWRNLKNYYNSTYANSGVSGFLDYFNISFAGFLDYQPRIQFQDEKVLFWSTTPGSSSDKAYYFSVSPSSLIDTWDNQRAMAYQIRCFKNNYEPIDNSYINVKFDFKGGKGSTTIISVKNGESLKQPVAPVRNHSIFSGWYLSGTDSEFVFTGSSIVSPIELYAKWQCEEGYNNQGIKCVKAGNSKEAKLISGSIFNTTIKSLANGTTFLHDYDKDITIKKIKRENVEPQSLSSLTDISSDDSDYPVYVWFDDGTLYYYSEAGIIYLNEDSSSMFREFNALLSIDISSFDTSNVTDMKIMFAGCTNLSELDLSNFNTSNVTNMASMFNGCKSLKSLDLSNFNTSVVTSMASMFSNCITLGDLNISNFNTINVTNMSYMFNWCKSLQTIDVSGFNTNNVTNMSYMFSYCNNLSSLNLSSFNTSNVTTMENMFGGCKSLQTIDVSNFNTSNVTNMRAMFSSCTNLSELDLSSFNTSSVTDMSYMFSSSKSLVSLDLSSFNTSSVTDMSYMFSYCNNLSSLNLSSFNTYNVTTMREMFSQCNNLSSLDLSSFNTYNVTDMYYMFSSCTNLSELDVSNFNTSSVTNMSHMFYNCDSFTTLDLSSFRNSNVTTLESMFYSCDNIESIYLPNLDTSKVTTMSEMFASCPKLKIVDISNFNTKLGNLYSTYYMFGSDYALKTIYAGENFLTDTVSNSSYMFSYSTYYNTQLMGGNGTKITSSPTDKTYAKIDGGVSNPGYFTDPSHFAIRFKNMNDEEILTQWISTGGKAQELKGNQSNYTYYVDKERTAEFNFNTSLYSYTEIYVDGISLLNEITIGTNNSAYGSVNTNILSAKYGEKITLSGNELIIGDNSILATPTESDNEFTYYFNGWDTTCGEGSNLTYYDEIIYKHDGDYYFDGTNYINTEAELFNTENYRKDFKLSFNIASYNSSETVEQGSFMSVMDETGRPRPGMVFRKKDRDGSSLEFTANGGEGDNQYFYNSSTTKKVKISRINSKIYIQLNDGDNSEIYDYTNFNSFFNVPLTIGSSLDGSLNPWRHVKGTLSGIELILVNTGVSNGDEVIGNCSLTANFSRVKKSYPVIFKNEDGMELNKKTLEYGIIPQYGGSTPTKASDTYYDYTFNGWNHQFSEVSGPQVYTATYNQSYKKYKITWKDGDNKILKEDLVSYDSEPSYNGDTPTKTSTLQTGYTFNGTWNPSIHKVTGEETYVAQFDETLNTYVITFLNEDNSFISSGEYNYGTVANSINQPSATKSSDGTYDYTFDRWIPELKTVTGDQTYKASYNSEYIDYTITFVDEDGTPLSGATYHSGDTVIPPDDPEKAADAQYTYSFNGWIPEVGVVTGNMTYTATYTGTINSYTITFLDDDETVIETKQVEYGTTSGNYKPTNNPEKLGHTFDKWFPDLVTVTTGATYKATYTPNKYLLTIEFGTGVESVAGEGFYDYDTEAIITGMAKQGYHFEGGDRVGEFIFRIPAYDFTGIVSAIPNTYMVRFQANDGVGTMEDQEFTYDLTGELKANGFRKNGHLFAGWISERGMYYPNKGKVFNLATGGIVNFVALWIEGGNNSDSNPSGAAGGGRTIEQNNNVKDQEHKAAEEKQETKQEQSEEQSKTPEKTNATSNQSSTQQSSSPSKESTTSVDPEIQSAYEWAYAHDVTTIPTLVAAMPDGVVKRGHLAKMVVNYATNVLGQEIPEKIPSECRWNDWRGDWESEEIKDYAVKSCALGLMGLNMPKFLPNMQVTRAQFGTIMSRLLWGKKYAGGTPYYRKHLNALKENGIMTQIDNPERRVELRQWVWLMLMRSAKNK